MEDHGRPWTLGMSFKQLKAPGGLGKIYNPVMTFSIYFWVIGTHEPIVGDFHRAFDHCSIWMLRK